MTFKKFKGRNFTSFLSSFPFASFPFAFSPSLFKMRFFKYFPVETSIETSVDDTAYGEPDHYETDCDDYPSDSDDSDDSDEYFEKYNLPSRTSKQHRKKRMFSMFRKSSHNSGRVNTKAMKVARGDKYFVDISSDVPADSSDDSSRDSLDDDIDEFGYSAEDRRQAELNMIEYFEWYYEDLHGMVDYIFDKLFPDESYLPRSSYE